MFLLTVLVVLLSKSIESRMCFACHLTGICQMYCEGMFIECTTCLGLFMPVVYGVLGPGLEAFAYAWFRRRE